jgi:O-antigen/teichoic acid export membrane protein
MSEPGEGRRIARDALLNVIGLGMSSAAGIVIVPLLLHSLGASLYGVYASAGAIAMLAAIDFGLGTATAREVALASARPSADSAEFIASAFSIQLALAVAAGLLVVALGYPLTTGVLSPHAKPAARMVFLLVGAALAGDQLTAAAAAVLAGLRRFIFINSVVIAGAAIRVIGALMIVHRRPPLHIVALFTIVSLMSAVIAIVYAIAREPRVSFLPRLSWRSVRSRAHFASLAQALQFLSKANWQIAVPLVSSLRSPAAAASVSVGQKFPLATMTLNWRATEVLMPAATERGTYDGKEGMRRVFETGMRGTALLAAQPFILFVVMAPWIISVWIKHSDPIAALVLQLMAVAVVIDTLAYPACQVLLAAGEAGILVRASAMALVVNVVLSVSLQFLMGPPGAAFAVLVAMGINSVVILRAVAIHLDISLRSSTAAMRSALGPAFASAALLALLVYRRPPQSLKLVCSYALASTAVYAAGCVAAFSGEIRRAFRARRDRGAGATHTGASS